MCLHSLLGERKCRDCDLAVPIFLCAPQAHVLKEFKFPRPPDSGKEITERQGGIISYPGLLGCLSQPPSLPITPIPSHESDLTRPASLSVPLPTWPPEQRIPLSGHSGSQVSFRLQMPDFRFLERLDRTVHFIMHFGTSIKSIIDSHTAIIKYGMIL